MQALSRLGLCAVSLSVISLIAGCKQDSAETNVPNSTRVSAAAASDPAIEQLRREGNWTVDSAGRVVLLHGVNAVWKIAPYYPSNDLQGFTEADALWLKDHGFNTVRLGVLFAGVMPKKGVVDTTYLEGVDRVVKLLADQGIWIMLDFHQDMYNEKFNGEGFPAWSVYDDGLPHPNNFGFPGNYLTPEVTRSFDNLYANRDQLWDFYRDAWVAVAKKWKSQPYLMGYDLINEPWTGSETATCANPVGCPAFDDQKLQKFQQHVLDGIRKVDSKNLVWFEPNILFDFGAKTNLGLLSENKDPALGFSWHTYCLPAALLHSRGVNDVPGCPELHQLVFSNAIEASTRLKSSQVLSEFGASDDLADVKLVADLADKNFTGWQYWHYKGWKDPTSEDPTGGVQSLFRNDTDLGSAKLEKLKVLERTYPMATAGTPKSLSFDSNTGKFSYIYTPKASTKPTEIYVPTERHYPKGYRLNVTGAAVKAGAGSKRLLIENTAGSGEVRIEITAN